MGWRRAHDGGRVTGFLRLTTFAYAAKTILEPALPGFLLHHGDLQVEVSVDNGFTDIVAAGLDAGIRFGETVEKGHDLDACRPRPAQRRRSVPRLPGRTGCASDADRSRRPRLRSLPPADTGGLLPWEVERDGRVINVRPKGSLIVSDGDLALAAVRAEADVDYFLADQMAGELASGALVLLLDGWCRYFPGRHIYHPSRRLASAALQALNTHLRKALL